VPDQNSGEGGATPPEATTPEGATPDGLTGGGATPKPENDDAQKLRDAGREALDKERTARRDAERRVAEAERRLAELEDAGKSEVERAIARLDRQSAELDAARARTAELESKLAERELLELKREIARELGMPIEAAHRLQGTDSRSIRADAQRYLEEKGVEGSLGVGRGGAAAGRTGADMNQLIREASGRQ
jgi:chromosome segregation ATPase